MYKNLTCQYLYSENSPKKIRAMIGLRMFSISLATMRSKEV